MITHEKVNKVGVRVLVVLLMAFILSLAWEDHVVLQLVVVLVLAGFLLVWGIAQHLTRVR